jgi:hypothetical protein
MHDPWVYTHEIDSSFHDVLYLHLSRRIRNPFCDVAIAPATGEARWKYDTNLEQDKPARFRIARGMLWA